MCTRPITIPLPNTLRDRVLGIQGSSSVQVPCGTCPECLDKRRKSIVSRCYNEALARGLVSFVTLTYDNGHLPITQSLWSCNRDTGEMSLYGDCTYVPNELDSDIRKRLLSLSDDVKRAKMRFIFERHSFSDFSKSVDYYINYSFSHRYDDVKRLIKRCRKIYNDIHGVRLDFSYLVVPEFGELSTRRPHYHCLFFGAPTDFIWFFHRSWSIGLVRSSKKFRESDLFERYKRFSIDGYGKYFHCLPSTVVVGGVVFPACYSLNPAYGFAYTEFVNRINDDKSDGYAKISAYLGKYVGKGVFEDSLVRDGFIELPRYSISHHFGELPKELVDWHLAKDKFDYNPDNLLGLSKDEIKKIAETIADRWFHELPCYTKPIGLPVQFKNQIFNRRVARNCKDLPAFFQYHQKALVDWPDSGKVYFSQIYYIVADILQHRAVQNSRKEFEQFVRNCHSKDICDAVSSFEAFQQARFKAREKASIERYRKKLQSAKL